MTANSYPPVSIFYGSQKGQAQAIAEEVFETARNEFSLTAELLCLSHPDTFVSSHLNLYIFTPIYMYILCRIS